MHIWVHIGGAPLAWGLIVALGATMGSVLGLILLRVGTRGDPEREH